MFTRQICSKDFRREKNMRRHVKTVHADFKDNETIDDRENPEIIAEDNASDKADDDEPYIKNKAETDGIDIDVEEEEEAEEEEDKEEDSDNSWRIWYRRPSSGVSRSLNESPSTWRYKG